MKISEALRKSPNLRVAAIGVFLKVATKNATIKVDVLTDVIQILIQARDLLEKEEKKANFKPRNSKP